MVYGLGITGVLVLFGNRTTGEKLHAYWDTTVVKRLGKDPAEVAASLEQRFGAQCPEWMQGNAADWAMESFGIARDFVYQLGEQTTDERDQPAYRLTPEYQRQARDVAAEQLEKAGCRLATVLNTTLR